MARVIVDAKLGFDQFGHARTAPQRRRVAEGFRAGQQHHLQPPQLRGAQLRQPACPARLPQRFPATLPVLPHPTAHRLAGDVQLAGDLRLRHALPEQSPPPYDFLGH
jgi:hypothetical protein